jgi:peptidoglycan/LPS O-acetylase OafA/YrhL
MKAKSYLVLFIALLVLLSLGLWAYFSPNRPVSPSIFLILVVVAFAVFLAVKRILSVRRGEPAEDEMSKRILQRTAATSYYVSIYCWVALIWVSDTRKLEAHTAIGAGILVMALVYALSWFYYKAGGIRN